MSDSSTTKDAPKEVLNGVAKEYEQTLVIPGHKPSPQWMLLSVGMVGSGKTTVIKPLAEHFHLIRISTDEVRERLKRRSYSYEGCRDIVYGLAEKYLGLGYSIAFDANTGSRHGLEYNARIKGKFPQVRQLFVHINPPETFIIEKLKNYRHSWLFKDGEHAVERFEVHKKNFILPHVPFVFTFDPSKEDLPEQLKRGVEAIQNNLQ